MARKTPVLDELLEKGLVRIQGESNEIIGKASDGTWVVLGSAHAWDYERIERYLTDNPTPDKW